jgi:glucosamine kinase
MWLVNLQAMTKLIAGIDAGGTQVRLRWRDLETGAEEQIRGAADPDGGPEPAVALLKQAPGEIVALAAGITKVSRGEIKSQWEKALAAACPEAQLTVVPDFVIAFHGAVPSGQGLLCVSGTGSVVYGENAHGNAVRVGGRGWEFGDEGSGAYVTTELMRRTLRACDGLWPQTALTQAVCAALGTSEAALVGERARQRALAEGRGFLVHLVHAQALAGDDEARGLFTGAAGWLARYVRAAYEQLGFTSTDAAPVALVGGMWELGTLMTEPFTVLLDRWMPGAVASPATGSPCEGALRLAERLVSVTR